MTVNCEFVGGPKDGVVQVFPSAVPEIKFPWEVGLLPGDDVLRPHSHGDYRYIRRAEVGIAAVYDFDPTSAPKDRR